eukprot:s2742_g15.t1
MLECKECEIARLVREVASRDESLSQHSVVLEQLNDRCADLESRLAASSAAHPPVVSDPSLTVPSQHGRVQPSSVQQSSADMSNHVSVILTAIQDLSVRMTQLESNSPTRHDPGLSSHVGNTQSQVQSFCQSHNVADCLSPSRRFPVGVGFVPTREGPPTVDESPGRFGQEEAHDDDEELVADRLRREKDLVDSRALQHARLDPVPSSAAEFRAWKHALILLLGTPNCPSRGEIPTILKLAWGKVFVEVVAMRRLGFWRLGVSWIISLFGSPSQSSLMASLIFSQRESSSNMVPRLDKWLASELIKAVELIPELQFKIQAYVEKCTRNATAPKGRAMLNTIARHFDLDRTRGSLIPSQSIFQVDLEGFGSKDLQNFSNRTMYVLNSIPESDWPNACMLGEWLFHRLKSVRKLERTMDEIKRSPTTSEMRDFDFLWSRLQELLVEEREDINAKSVGQMLLRPGSEKVQPTSKVKAATASASVAPKAEPKGERKKGAGKDKVKGSALSAEQKSKTPCIFHKMPSGCVRGEKCQYLHEPVSNPS